MAESTPESRDAYRARYSRAISDVAWYCDSLVAFYRRLGDALRARSDQPGRPEGGIEIEFAADGEIVPGTIYRITSRRTFNVHLDEQFDDKGEPVSQWVRASKLRPRGWYVDLARRNLRE